MQTKILEMLGLRNSKENNQRVMMKQRLQKPCAVGYVYILE